jgi:hypothetical protein
VVVKVSLRLGSGKKAFKILSGKIRSDRFLVNNMKKFLLDNFKHLKYSQSIALSFPDVGLSYSLLFGRERKNSKKLSYIKEKNLNKKRMIISSGIIQGMIMKNCLKFF